MHCRTFRFGSNLVLILVLIVLAVAPAAALEVTAASKDVELTIGDDLILSWDGLAPEALYRAAVTDEAGQLIVEVSLKSDSDGVVPSSFVWLGTGLVGCDEVADPASDEYRFARLEEAEAMLKSRTFDLTLVDDETQAAVARILLRLATREQNILYFSDAAGCPRCRFSSEEPVFLTGMRVVLDDFWLFLVEPFDDRPETGEPLEDIDGQPREIWPPGSYFTEQVASSLPSAAEHMGVVRPIDDDGAESEPDPFWSDLDVIIHPSYCGYDECEVDVPDPMNLIRVRPPDKKGCGK